MDKPNRREIACAVVIDTQNRLLLQQRDDVPGILHPGKVSLFGGHREGSETYLQCAVRELNEELSYFIAPERFEPLAIREEQDPDVGGGSLYAEFFVVRDVPHDAIVVTEGQLLIVSRDQLALIDRKLTPSARFALGKFSEIVLG